MLYEDKILTPFVSQEEAPEGGGEEKAPEGGGEEKADEGGE